MSLDLPTDNHLSMSFILFVDECDFVMLRDFPRFIYAESHGAYKWTHRDSTRACLEWSQKIVRFFEDFKSR